MKVLQVIDTLNAGGAERVLIDIANVLAQKSLNVTVLTIVSHGSLAGDLNSDVKLLCLYRKFKFDPFKAVQFIKLLNQYDIVHIHMRHVLKYYWFAQLFTQCKARVLFHDHYGDIEFNRNVPFYFRALRKTIFYVGVSNQLFNWARSKVGFVVERIFLLHNIVLLEPIRRKQRSDQSIKRLVMVSNFRRTKNIEFSLQVAAVMKKKISFSLDIFGVDQDKEYLEELIDLRKNLSLEDSVNFIFNDPNIRYRLSEYSLALHCARSETGPLVLIEYIASQLPFISFQTGEVYNQVAEFFPDFFMDNFKTEAWVERAQKLLNGESQVGDARFNEIFEKFYSREGYARNILNIYSSVTLETDRA